MKALVKTKREPGIWLEQVPVPEIKVNEVLIKIKKTAICGTDLHIYKWDEWAQKTIPTPMHVGHEFIGEIVQIGSNVSILDPFGNAAHTALSFNLIGEDILITGAGPIGCMAVAICKKVGAKNVVITDINDYRLGLAKEMGADAAINVSDCKNSADIESKIRKTMHELQMEEGFDVGLEMSGVEVSIHAMVDLMINGGKIAMLGISGKNVALDWDKVVFKSLLLKGIYGREMFETWYKMSSLVKSGLDINKIITHTLPISEYLTGFELMKSGKCGKVILDWTV